MVTSPAYAGKKVDRFFPLDGAPGTDAGQFNTPRDVAINDPANTSDGSANSGWVYVADASNHRVQAFNADGDFQFAIGRDVSAAQTTGEANTAAEKCTAAADCKSGTSSAFSGGLGGMFSTPQGIAINQDTGHFYVRDSGNRRVQEFEADGDFVRAWGGDVVQSGGTGDVVVAQDERQTVTLVHFFGTVTGGTFTLTFDGQQTDTVDRIPYNATPAQVQAALEGLSNIDPGDVTVSASNPGGGSAAGGPYTVDFAGAYAGVNVPQMTGNASTLTGTGFFGQVNVQTNRQGGPVASFEICSVAAECQAGADGGGAGIFGSPGSGVTGIAIDPVSGNVYVADPGPAIGSATGKRIQEFEPDGEFVRLWGFNVVLSGPGDDLDTDGGGPDLANQFEICVPSDGDACQSVFIPGTFASGNPGHLAIGSDGILYASDSNASNRVMRFDTGETAPGSLLLPPLNVTGLSETASTETTGLKLVDGKLYVARSAAIGILEISNPAGVSPSHSDTHVPGSGLTPNGFDFNPSSDDLYFSSSSSVGGSPAHRVYVADDDGAAGAPDVTINPPTGVGTSTASFSGTLNPGGFPTSYRFETSKNGVTWTAVKPNESVGSGTDPVTIDDDVSNLEANTVYRVRVLVTRGFGNGSVPSSELTFATDAVPPDVTTLEVQSVSDTVAQLRGTVNPNNLATTYWFEYGGASYGNQVPVLAASAGSAGTLQAVIQQLGGLAPAATYHYRLCAENAEGQQCGADMTFTTRAPRSASDGRAFELVSPANKVGGVGVCGYANSRPGMRGCGAALAAIDGERVAVFSNAGAVLLDGKFSYASDYAFAERASDAVGWLSHSPFTHSNYSPSARRFAALVASSDDLSLLGWGSNTSHIGVFPEVGPYPQPWDVGHLSDWDGKWEVAGPTSTDQMAPGFTGTGGISVRAVSGGGGRAVLVSDGPAGYRGGLSGPDDPHLDRTAGKALYVEDVSRGLSDTFPGEGIRIPAGVCSAGTELPGVDGSGRITGRSCPPPVEYAPGEFRAASLVSGRGAAFGGSTTDENAISSDGTRVFFSDQETGAPAACTGSGDATACPSQLYVRQENPDGSVVVRWISRPSVADQDGTLLGQAIFEGASADGTRVFFKTQTPLTPDDPDGAGVAPPAGGVTTGPPGGAGNDSWDLYMAELAPGNDPTGPGFELTRLSAGPDGASDCNVAPSSPETTTSLRIASESGERLYFTCAAPLDGVAAAANGTSTSQGGTPTTTATRNLYHYDASKSLGQRWQFVTALGTTQPISTCASTGTGGRRSPITTDGTQASLVSGGGNCVSGTSAGDFITFMTRDPLVSDDPEGNSADVYAYDATADRLSRISAPQGGTGASYPCVTSSAVSDGGQPCYGELGSLPALITEPANSGDRVAFLQSRSRLTPDDDDDAFDVYEWRNGELSLLTPKTSRGAWFTGASADGEDVFIEAMDRLSWQDTDAVMDVYDLRRGGGILKPTAPPAPCAVLAGACQTGGASPLPVPSNTTSLTGGDGNVVSGARKTLRVGKPSKKARRRAARTGKLAVAVRVSMAGKVRAVAKGRIGKRPRRVARKSVQVRKAGVTRLKLRLSRAARQRLSRGKALKLSIKVTSRGARSRSITVRLPGGKS